MPQIKVGSLAQLAELWEQRGPLITPGLACVLVPCNRKHLYNLVDRGVFTSVMVHGQLHLLLSEVFTRWPHKLWGPKGAALWEAGPVLTSGRSGGKR